MNIRFPLSRIVGFLASLGVTCMLLAVAAQAVPARNAPSVTAPPDSIMLRPAVPGGKGELPPVPFRHDVHTKAVEEAGKDCATCHAPLPKDAGKNPVSPNSRPFSYDFKNTKSKPGSDPKNRFHDGCLSCHDQRAGAGKKTGPLAAECRSCHLAASPLPRADFLPAFDKSMHYRHIASPFIPAPDQTAGQNAAANCAACHHPVPGAAAGQNTRESCRSCHTPFTAAAHDSCIPCHLTAARAKKPTGPVNCAGCHDPAIWNAYAKVSPVPRLPAGQPEARVMTPGKNATATMPPVPFNHVLHEQAVPACVTCHAGNGIAPRDKTARALDPHAPASAVSCVGCHERRKTTTPQCAGCHTPQAVLRPDCAFCHKPASDKDKLMPLLLAAERSAISGTEVKAQTPPETVTIGALASEYEPGVMPHGAIIRALDKGIKSVAPGLAPRHAADYALCASCHHNSPPSATPPRCASCHSPARPRDAGAAAAAPLPPDGRPFLKEAYHQQCMGCHQRMRIAKPADTDCAACHAERQPQAPGKKAPKK